MLYALQKRLQKPLATVLTIVKCPQNQCLEHVSLDSAAGRGSRCNTRCRAWCQEQTWKWQKTQQTLT